MTTRLIVVVSHEAFRRDLIGYLQLLDRGYEVVGAFGTGAEALVQLDELQPNIVLIEPTLPDSNGLSLARFITQLWPATAVALLSDDAASYERETQDVEALGYVDKIDLVRQLPETLARLTAAVAVTEDTLADPT